MKRVFLSLIVIFLCLSLASKAYAQNDAMFLTVFPAVQDKLIKPGEKTRFLIQFRNGSDKTVSGSIKVADFTILDREGTPQLIEDKNLTPKYGASSWITPSTDRITIPARDYVSIDLAVDLPSDIGTCGKYAMVYFEPVNPSLENTSDNGQRQSAAQLVAKIGGIINFEVENQECKEGLRITNFSLPKFQEYGPIDVGFDLLNLGDIHLAPRGMVMMTNLFGKTADQRLLEEKRIFPETAKNHKLKLGSKWMLGRYKVTLDTSYGKKAGQAVESVYVWVFPWRIALIIFLAVIITGFFLKKTYAYLLNKESRLEEELRREKEEIERLKEALKSRD